MKDRVALRSKMAIGNEFLLQLRLFVELVIDDAERQGLLHPRTGSRIFEGTVGSTGISIATITRAR